MAKVDKISMGRKAKRAFFNMSHQVNTTLSYGFAEPTMCLDVIPDTKLDVQSYTGVRLAPLPQPTTGKIALKQFYSYVKTKEVFEAFDNLQSQTSVGSSRGSYVPVQADTVDNQLLLLSLIIQSAKFLSGSLAGSEPEFDNRDVASQLFRLSFNSTLDIYGRSKTEVHNIWEDVRRAFHGDNTTTAFNVLQAFYHNVYDNRYKIARQLGQCLGVSGADLAYGTWTYWLQFANFDAELKAFIDTNGLPSSVAEDLEDYKKFLDAIAPADTFVFDKNLTFENADFYFEIEDANRPTMYIGDANGYYEYEDDTNYHTYIGVHLTPAGKRLFKILNCIGVNFGYRENVELPKLYAYYKAWFDIFNPGRNLQWKDTNCYKIIHSFYDSPDWTVTEWSRYLYNGVLADSEVSMDYLYAVGNFFVDLAQCFYTEKSDPITVATSEPVLYAGSSCGSNSLLGFSLFTNSDIDNQNIYEGYGQNTDDQGGLNIRFLQSLYNWVNKNTVIGQRVAQYMAEHFGVSIPTTSFIDKDSFDIDIVDSIATVNNDQTALGEYAGLGKGRATGQRHKFTAPDFGYFFQFTVVVPNGGYVQAGTKAKVRRFDWFQPQFDSLGMAPISMYEVASRNSFLNSINAYENPTFGFRPRYFEQKYKNNLANGGFSFRSDRAKFLGYSLDRLFSEPELYRADTYLEPGVFSPVRNNSKLMEYKGVTLRPDEELRYIGKDESFGNYDRIFYDTTGHTDNFIAYIDNTVKMYANMKPISDSFETYDETQDTDTVQVSHS